MADKIEQYLGTGRRKTSVARVYMRPGKGRFGDQRQRLEEVL
jgi:ribosomal protein S9